MILCAHQHIQNVHACWKEKSCLNQTERDRENLKWKQKWWKSEKVQCQNGQKCEKKRRESIKTKVKKYSTTLDDLCLHIIFIYQNEMWHKRYIVASMVRRWLVRNVHKRSQHERNDMCARPFATTYNSTRIKEPFFFLILIQRKTYDILIEIKIVYTHCTYAFRVVLLENLCELELFFSFHYALHNRNHVQFTIKFIIQRGSPIIRQKKVFMLLLGHVTSGVRILEYI